jgi:seryl-tRNA synthetase
LIAILENGWSEERGGIVVPEVLRPFMSGLDFIGKKK